MLSKEEMLSAVQSRVLNEIELPDYFGDDEQEKLIKSCERTVNEWYDDYLDSYYGEYGPSQKGWVEWMTNTAIDIYSRTSYEYEPWSLR